MRLSVKSRKSSLCPSFLMWPCHPHSNRCFTDLKVWLKTQVGTFWSRVHLDACDDGCLTRFSSSVSESSMPAEMTMLADHPARQLLDFSQKLDINLLDNVVNSMHHDIGSQVSNTAAAACQRGSDSYLSGAVGNIFLFFFVFVFNLLLCCVKATSGSGGAHQPQGPPRRLDQGGHHPGVLTEHEN